jgi:hypothetical protein
MSFIGKQNQYEAQLDWLLSFISGKVEPFEIGFASYRLDNDPQSKQLHRACMELERRGLIEPWFECEKLIVWRPKTVILTDKETIQ